MTVGELKERIKHLSDDYEVAPMLGDYDLNTNTYIVSLVFGEKNDIENLNKNNLKNITDIKNLKIYQTKEMEDD